jgi:radical SAM-linked protein
MAYSSGFSPHPKISYANAAPTGVASEAEYVEIGVVSECDPHRVRAELDRVLPPGLDVVDVVVARTSDFVARLEASHWHVELPGVCDDHAQHAVTALLAASEVIVERMTKNGMRAFDVRSAVLRLHVVAQSAQQPRGGTALGGECAILEMVVRHGSPAVRPDDVLAALSKVADLVPPDPPRITRVAQGPLLEDGWSVGDPFAADRS